jgi:hypothetical protein
MKEVKFKLLRDWSLRNIHSRFIRVKRSGVGLGITV